jgi:hypothetical protein
LSPLQPLKLLHGILDHGIEVCGRRNRQMIPTIGVSNYELNFAHMNRGIVICTELPKSNELVSIFSYKSLPARYKPWETHRSYGTLSDRYLSLWSIQFVA